MTDDAPSVALAASAFAASEALNDFYLRLVSEPNPDRWHMGLIAEVNDMAAVLWHGSAAQRETDDDGGNIHNVRADTAAGGNYSRL